jgi:L,D-peptidoglycan transpeptidase YkuD (ErfK/YbiS/YcfS/YnhG family)
MVNLMHSLPLLLGSLGMLALPLLSAGSPGARVMVVHRQDGESWCLEWQGHTYRCAIGRGGLAREGRKKEGDGCTPCGAFRLRRLYYRPDKVASAQLPAALKPTPLSADDGWCDDPGDRAYNTFVKLPYAGRHERLWRPDDDVYDLIVPLGYNDGPIVRGAGSAIFLHVARPGYSPTAGCVALDKRDLLAILATVDGDCQMWILPED